MSRKGKFLKKVFNAIKKNKLSPSLIQEMKKHRHYLETTNEEGENVFRVSACLGRINFVKQFIVLGVDLNSPNKDNTTPLMGAAGAGHALCMNALIKAKANIHMRDDNGHTALNYAAYYGHPNCVKVLIKAKADIDQQGYKKDTVLYDAASQGHRNCVDILIEAKANLESRDIEGSSPLITAAEYGRKECVDALLAAKADVNAKDNINGTAIMFASLQKQVDCVQTLIDAKAQLDVVATNSGWTALAVAVRNSDIPTLLALIIAGAKQGITEEDHPQTIYNMIQTYATTHPNDPHITLALAELRKNQQNVSISGKMTSSLKRKNDVNSSFDYEDLFGIRRSFIMRDILARKFGCHCAGPRFFNEKPSSTESQEEEITSKHQPRF